MEPTIFDTGFTALDIETTGLSHRRCGIVEIAAYQVLPDGSARAFQQLVNPQRDIPARVIAIHGITASMVEDQPPADSVVPELVSFVGSSPLVLHNAPFDLGFLTPIVLRQGLAWQSPAVFDTLPLSRQLFPGMDSYSLENLSRFFDFETGGHHRALADCRYTAQLFMRVLKKIKAREMPAEELKERFASPPELLGRA